MSAFFKLELIASTILILVLLAIGVGKKERVLSDAAISGLKGHWRMFQLAFSLGLIAMLLFLALLTTEMLEAGRGAAFRSIYGLQAGWLKVSMVFALFVLNLVNLYVLITITGGGK
ncbi:MAG: hypothetical protein D6733_01735 [Methanobacteriota archaeon]|nr:MAG: hypothetical protein D6733_01735 [Euryarchaeota archaeon]